MKKQATYYTCDGDQIAELEFVPEMDGVLAQFSEEGSDKTFRMYMTRQEAIAIGKELINLAKYDTQ